MRLLASIASVLLAVPLAAVHLPVLVFTYADGMGRDLARCVVEDSRGFVWLCTAEGLSRFDGYRFTNFSTSDGLPHRTITAAVQSSGVLIVGTESGLARLNPAAPDGSSHRFLPTKSPNQTPRGIIALFAARDGLVWAGGYGGIYSLANAGKRDETLTWIALGQGVTVNGFAEDDSGNLWIGASDGLWRRDGSGAVQPMKLSLGPVFQLLSDPGGCLWAGTASGLWRLRLSDGSVTKDRVFGETDGLASPRIHALYRAPDGKLWVGTALSLSVQNASGGFHSYTNLDGIPGRAVFAIYTDRAGNLWAGADHGLVRIARDGFHAYAETDGIGVRAISTILEDGNGNLFAVSNHVQGPRVHRLKNGRFFEMVPHYGHRLRSSGWGWAQTALIDRVGDWWIATGEGLYRFPARPDAASILQSRPDVFLRGEDIFRLFEDTRGDLWVSSVGRGLAHWDRKSGTLSKIIGLPSPGVVSAFAQDRAGNLWLSIGNEAGTGIPCAVVRYRNGKFEVWRSGTANVPSGWISSLLLDHNGRLWIGSGNDGLALVQDPTAEHPAFQIHSAKLPSVAVRCLAEDSLGRIYAAGPRGLVRLDATSGQERHFTTAQGYPSGACGALHFDRQGVLWAGASLGLARLDPSPDASDTTPPIYVNSVTVNGEAQTLSGSHILDASQNRIHIEFVSPDAISGAPLEYHYRLLGTTSSQSYVSAERSVEYASLAPGSYRFEVRAATEGGRRSAQPASFAFEILPPFWRRTWFVALLFVAIAGALLLAHRIQLARQLELERIRTGIAADLHDDLGASLTRVAILAAAPHPPHQSAAQLQQIAETARGLIDSLSDVVWAVDPRQDDFRSLLQRIREVAAELLEPQGIAWALEPPPGIAHTSLRADQRRHLFLIAKEALRNAARHGHCRNVTIEVNFRGEFCDFCISDDGQGFDPSFPRQGNGLDNMQARAVALRAHIEIHSTPGAGASIRVRFPLRPHGHALGKFKKGS